MPTVKLPPTRPQLVNGRYGCLVERLARCRPARDHWNKKPKDALPDWKPDRKRWEAFYDVLVLWGMDHSGIRAPESPQQRSLEALWSSRGVPVMLSTYLTYYTAPESTRALPPAESSYLYKLLVRSLAARRPGATILGDVVPFELPVGLYVEFTVTQTKQDEDRDALDEGDVMRYSAARKALRASLIVPGTPLDEAVSSVYEIRGTTYVLRHTTSRAICIDSARTYENAPLTDPALVPVGVDVASSTCDVSRAVAVPSPGGGMSSGVTVSPTGAAGASASAAPGALTTTVSTGLMDDEEAAGWFMHRYGRRWWRDTKEAGLCRCGAMMRTKGRESPYCPRCQT